MSGLVLGHDPEAESETLIPGEIVTPTDLERPTALEGTTRTPPGEMVIVTQAEVGEEETSVGAEAAVAPGAMEIEIVIILEEKMVLIGTILIQLQMILNTLIKQSLQ